MTVKSDKHIHQDVLRELRWDSRVDQTRSASKSTRAWSR